MNVSGYSDSVFKKRFLLCSAYGGAVETEELTFPELISMPKGNGLREWFTDFAEDAKPGDYLPDRIATEAYGVVVCIS